MSNIGDSPKRIREIFGSVGKELGLDAKVDAERLVLFDELRLRAEEIANLTGTSVSTVLRQAVANHVAAVKLSYLRGGFVAYVEKDGTSKKLKLPRPPHPG